MPRVDSIRGRTVTLDTNQLASFAFIVAAGPVDEPNRKYLLTVEALDTSYGKIHQRREGPDSVQRLNYLVNVLAQNEVHVARYYMKRGAYVAAANRAQYSLKTYPQATANEEGLLILVQAYDKLGMTDLRNDAERVLKTNFPNSKYLSGKVDNSKPWWQLWNW